MERLSVEGIDSVLQAAEEHQDKAGGVFILFCGSVQPHTGDSWCPDCVKAEPVIEKVVGEQKGGVFIRCSVGERDAWKNPQNEFRKHPKLLLKGVPTLLQWNTAKKLVEEDCANGELVKMMFEDD